MWSNCPQLLVDVVIRQGDGTIEETRDRRRRWERKKEQQAVLHKTFI